MYPYLKALHIIFVVTWFAGLFYIVRLFIYHQEAFDKDQPAQDILIEQYKIMERRLWYGITWPSAVLTLVFGGSLLSYYMPLGENPWLIAKLGMVLLLFLYHHSCGVLRDKFLKGPLPWDSQKLRVWNEVPTIFLFGIVFLVVLKSLDNILALIAGVIVLTALLFLGIKSYKRVRDNSKGGKSSDSN